MMMRDFFREGRDIDAARLLAEHDREKPRHRFIATRNPRWTRFRRSFSLFGFPWAMRHHRRR
jgi:hypothetical protein